MTIFAPATPHQKSAIGILRLSGSMSIDALKCLAGAAIPDPRVFAVRQLTHPTSGEIIDEAGVIVFRGPESYTGEDVVEIHHHGSTSVRRELIGFLSAQPGIRIADPGEFTKRGFLNGRFDVMAAEGVQALIAAETKMQSRQAVAAVSGHSDKLVQGWRRTILTILSRLEAEIDFGEDEIIEPVVDEEMVSTVSSMIEAMRQALHDAPVAERISRGALVVLTGPPNSGKSSLLNALADRDVAIVSDEPGTTRDALEVQLDLNGLALTLVDTAGIRRATSTIERMGIDRALEARARADVICELRDRPELLGSVADEGCVAVLSKADLWPDTVDRLPEGAIAVSSVTGEGIDQLIAVLGERIGGGFDRQSALSLTNERQRTAMSEALQFLDEFLTHLDEALDVQCERLRLVASALGRLTGRIDSEEILDEIFASFCIGK